MFYNIIYSWNVLSRCQGSFLCVSLQLFCLRIHLQWGKINSHMNYSIAMFNFVLHNETLRQVLFVGEDKIRPVLPGPDRLSPIYIYIPGPQHWSAIYIWSQHYSPI